MRILYLAQLLPLPLDAGPKIRAYYVLRHLAESGHDVTLACFSRADDRQADVEALARICSAVETVPLRRSRLNDLADGLGSLASKTPFLIRRDRFPAMDDRLRTLMNRRSFDAVHADQLWMAQYATRHAQGPLTVLDQHNAVFRVPERLAASRRNPALRFVLRREAAKLEAFERAMFDRFDRVVWVSEDDRAAFGVGGTPDARARHQVIPIAIDPGVRVPMPRPRPFRVTFLGGIHWPPNAEGVRWFAERVWPRVAPAVPRAVFTVIGKGSPGRLGGSTALERVEVTGYVASLDSYLAETAVFVVPLMTGAGMRVKILDAWCWGLPVVSTTVGAEGIRTTPGENVLVADDETRFAEAVIRVLGDGTLARRLADNGRSTVEALYDWRSVYQAWNRVYQ